MPTQLIRLCYTAATICCYLFLVSCEEEETIEDPTPTITTLRYTLVNPSDDNDKIIYYQDLDGVGGQPPIIEADTLAAESIYFGTIELLNETTSDATQQDFTARIETTKDDHQLFFIVNGLDLEIIYADADNSNNPVGLFTAINTGAKSMGTLTINLQRGLDKFNATVQAGDILGSTGKTDIQVSIPIVID